MISFGSKAILPGILILGVILITCSNFDSAKHSSVGDIVPDPTLDGTYEVCSENNIMQYHNLNPEMLYEGEKYAILEEFKAKYYKSNITSQSGLIRIRFVVNCKGQTGRFRMISSDFDYNKIKFDTAITAQILTITKNLKGWKVLSEEGSPKDYYQYLIFKIENGEIKEIMP